MALTVNELKGRRIGICVSGDASEPVRPSKIFPYLSTRKL